MNRRRAGTIGGTIILFTLAASLAGCGFKRQLVAITISPPVVNITGADVIVNFKAYGHYIHPPEVHDVTNAVTWASAAPQIVSIDPNSGVATSGAGCGSNITISATSFSFPDNHSAGVVVGTAAVSVTQVPNCP